MTSQENPVGRDQTDISDEAFLAIHDLLKARNAPKPGSFSSLNEDERRTYFTTARKRNRGKERAAKDRGDIPPTAANMRAALSDAALMILYTNGPGSEQIRHVLAKVYETRPGVPMTIETRIRRGRLRPLLIAR